MPALKANQSTWLFSEAPALPIVQALSEALSVDLKIATLLVQRGVSTFDEAKAFFRPELTNLHNPFLMKDMEKAVERIIAAEASNERIMIYGDYDVDGTTAVALVFAYLKPIFGEDRICYYIPDRYSEGYGISFKGIDVAEEAGCSLIIALDCGIRSVDKVNYALEKRIDFIICDHHLPGALLPEAYAVLDPKQSDCTYPYKELSGCGIGFKLMQALHQRNPSLPDPCDLLDLVATSIAADIVPITGENRILAFHGMQKINHSPRPGLKALLVSSKDLSGDSGQRATQKELTITDLVFTAAPRINAAGRIDHGKKAVGLLLSENLQDASEAVFYIHQNNATRRTLDQQITAEALTILENNPDTHANILYQPHWHKGVVGIVASRVMEQYYRPTLVLTESNGKITGSARSVRDFDIHEAIAACGDLLEQFGGHKYAAGLTMKPEHFEEFSIRFEQVVATTIKPEQKIPVVEIDLEIEPVDITPKFYRVMKQLAPFGPGNMTPVFLSRGLFDDGSARIVGTNHLKLRLGKAGQPYFDAIAFNMGELLPSFSMGLSADVCYAIEENHWNGKTTLQWVVKDIRF